MGVKTLWSVFDGVKQPTPASELKGQTIAVDLSAWVCESLAAVHALRPYLRTLFYRAVNLSRLEIKLVFVIEGKAPAIKWKTMANRPPIPRSSGQSREKRKNVGRFDGSRAHFKALLAECCDLLDTMGLPYLQSAGEGEALCAVLNREGLVDGIFTEDSDAFLYGARTVYRNLVASSKECSVDAYRMQDIEETLGLNRNKLIGMSLLIGCDYKPDGVPQVGKKKALALMKIFGNIDVLERFHSWRNASNKDSKPKSLDDGDYVDDEDDDDMSEDEDLPKKKKLKKNKVKQSLEDKIKCKAMLVTDFPNQRVIDEFMKSKEMVPSEGFKWSMPQLIPMMKLLKSTVKWSFEKTVEKALKMMTAMTMRDLIAETLSRQQVVIQPIEILSTCRKQWVQCFDIQWNVPECTHFKMPSEIFQTTEPVEMFSAAYPQLSKAFYDKIAAEKEEKEAAKKSPKRTVKLSAKNSRMLQLIRKAISALQDVKGSSIEDIQNYIISTEGSVGDVKLDITRGLNFGLKNGSLKEYENGRYRISKCVVMMEKMMMQKTDLSKKDELGSEMLCEGLVRRGSDDVVEVPDVGEITETSLSGGHKSLLKNKQMLITDVFNKSKQTSPQSSSSLLAREQGTSKCI
ncbi:flap endonuclease GEN homolog 1-like [Glandiceps talaboti]